MPGGTVARRRASAAGGSAARRDRARRARRQAGSRRGRVDHRRLEAGDRARVERSRRCRAVRRAPARAVRVWASAGGLASPPVRHRRRDDDDLSSRQPRTCAAARRRRLRHRRDDHARPDHGDHPTRTATVDDAGRFTVEGVSLGRWRVEADVPGHAQTSDQVIRIGGDDAITVRVVRTGSMSGVVVDSHGTPVPNATIVLRDQAGVQRPLGSRRRDFAGCIRSPSRGRCLRTTRVGSARRAPVRDRLSAGEVTAASTSAPCAAPSCMRPPTARSRRSSPRAAPRPARSSRSSTAAGSRRSTCTSTRSGPASRSGNRSAPASRSGRSARRGSRARSRTCTSRSRTSGGSHLVPRSRAGLASRGRARAAPRIRSVRTEHDARAARRQAGDPQDQHRCEGCISYRRHRTRQLHRRRVRE